ncbi:hypothetical protein FG379_001572 [Cryptosporidium bovis]|uniref:uncharacterized protein n=1 Tax=Cryptosporidium bovis TaxID=310047 RepID=UPI00351A1C07|nr:hypothetical protein FG379_001572 [Cryptosporidium bovis]
MECKKKLILSFCCLLVSVFCNKVNVIIDESGVVKLSLTNKKEIGENKTSYSNNYSRDIGDVNTLNSLVEDNKKCELFGNYISYNECRKLAGGLIAVILTLIGITGFLFQYLSGVPGEYIREDENSHRNIRRCCCTYRVELIEPKRPKSEINK